MDHHGAGFATVGAPQLRPEHVIIRDKEQGITHRDEIRRISGEEKPLDVVYDGVGAAVFEASLGLLRKRGLMATFGNASGPVEPVSPLALSAGGSLFLTRPTLFDYIATREELLARAGAVFTMIGDGALDVRIDTTYPLEAAADAHRHLEERRSTGKILLTP